MKKIPFLLLLLLPLLISLPNSLKAQESSLAKSVFWEISGKNLKKPSYLFGTHHLYDYQFLVNNENIYKKIKSIDAVMGEIIMDDADLSLLMKMSLAMMMKDNSLEKLLSKEDYAATDACLKDVMGFGLQTFNKFKPIAVYQLIMVGKYAKVNNTSLNSDQNSIASKQGSMDAYFQELGKKYKKELRALETVEQQLSVLYDGYTVDKQVEMLLDIVYDRDSVSTQEIYHLNDLYQQQDIEGLLKLMHKNTSEEEIRFMLADRNQRWIPQIESLLQNGKTLFIAVGAGHLPGKFGVIKLLQEQGYTLKPIDIAIKNN